MKASMNRPTRLGVLIGIVGAMTIGVLFARIVAAFQVGYDYKASIEKLKKIGAALQVYRETFGVKPVEERETYSDAGLPPVMIVLARQDRPWSVEGGVETFQVPMPNRLSTELLSHFGRLYYGPEQYEKRGSLAPIFQERGENMAVFADINMHEVDAFATPGAELDAIILRLNGEVEIVKFKSEEGIISLLRK